MLTTGDLSLEGIFTTNCWTPIMAAVNGDVPQTNGHPSTPPPSLLRTAPSQPALITISNPTIPLTSPQDNKSQQASTRYAHAPLLPRLHSISRARPSPTPRLRVQTFLLCSLRCSTSLVRRLYLATNARKGRSSWWRIRRSWWTSLRKCGPVGNSKSVAVSIQWWEWRSRIEQGVFVGNGTEEE